MTETKVEVTDEPKEVETKPEVDSTIVKKEEEKEVQKEEEQPVKEDKDVKNEEEIKKEEVTGDLTDIENKIIRQIKVCVF